MLVIILGVSTLNSLSKSKILTEFINNSNNSMLIIRGTAKYKVKKIKSKKIFDKQKLDTHTKKLK